MWQSVTHKKIDHFCLKNWKYADCNKSFITHNFSGPGRATIRVYVCLCMSVNNTFELHDFKLQHTLSMLVRLDDIWVKFKGHGRRSNFKVIGGMFIKWSVRPHVRAF